MNTLKQRDKNQKDNLPKRNGREFKGVVVSTKMNKTIVVAVKKIYKDPIYKKAVRRTKKLLAHNELDSLKPGDKVKIKEVPPISKNKHFIVMEKLL